MFARLCFWKPHKGNDFAILRTSSEDLDGLALQDEEYNEIHQWERESLNCLTYLHRKSSLSACTSYNQPSALVLATWNEIECTHSNTTSEDSLGSLVTASETLEQVESMAEHVSVSETRSNRSSMMSVSFDEKYAQLLMYSQDDESNDVSELDASASSGSDDGDETNTNSVESIESIESVESQSEQSDADSYKDDDTNDGYKADDDECESIDNVPSDEHTGSLGIAYPHPVQLLSDAESLAWKSEATEVTRMLQRYDAGMCCAGNAGNDSESSDSSVWSDVR